MQAAAARRHHHRCGRVMRNLRPACSPAAAAPSVMLPGKASAAAAPGSESTAVLYDPGLFEELLLSGGIECLDTMGKGECFLDSVLLALGLPSSAEMRRKARGRLPPLSLCSPRTQQAARCASCSEAPYAAAVRSPCA